MPYELGIDLGTTYSAAAVHRDGRVFAVILGNRAPSVPSVVLLREDGDLLTGEAASRRAATEPGRVAREFKRRLGDPTPLILGSTPYSAESLTAKLLRWIIDTVTAREGEAPRSIALTHPANWGAYKRDLLLQAIRLAGLDGALLLTEPEAAAIHYASQERVEPGTLVAVYDLGGGTFDAAVLRKRGDDAFEILGQPEGIERLGGIDFDEAVFRYVVDAAGDPLQSLDVGDANTHAALVRLREECVEAKEALSSDTEVTIPVVLPNLQTEVRLTRRELEAMVRPTLNDTIDSLRRALRSADVEASELDKVLLVGGSSRIPIVAQMVSAELDRPVAVDADPKFAVASGAALAAARALASSAAPAPAPAPPPPPPIPSPPPPTVEVAAVPPVVPPPREPAFSTSESFVPPGGGSGRRNLLLLAGGLLVAALLGAVVLLTRGGGEDPEDSLPYVVVTNVEVDGDSYTVEFETENFEPSIDDLHVHLFWDTTARETAGENGDPEPGGWVATDETPVSGEFLIADRPEDATAICALVGNADHEIADLDDDGEPDADSGDCYDLPDEDAADDAEDEASEHDGPFVEVTNIFVADDVGKYAIEFETFNFEPDMANWHIHFFWDTTPRGTAGANGDPEPGEWLAYAGASPAIDELFLVEDRPEEATAICALIGNVVHEIADVDDDGLRDLDTGDCYDLPDE
jgi:actin-like ATPase involved in cell morphogenesis